MHLPADDYIKPPELGIVEKMVTRIPHARFILIPISDQKRGHRMDAMTSVWVNLGQSFCMRQSPSRSRTSIDNPRCLDALLYWTSKTFASRSLPF
jgi:hypothetical protein